MVFIAFKGYLLATWVQSFLLFKMGDYPTDLSLLSETIKLIFKMLHNCMVLTWIQKVVKISIWSLIQFCQNKYRFAFQEATQRQQKSVFKMDVMSY